MRGPPYCWSQFSKACSRTALATLLWFTLGYYRLRILGRTNDLLLLGKLGQDRSSRPTTPLLRQSSFHRARQLRAAIERAVRYMPGSANCYAQALAASFWLRRFGLPYAVFLGVSVEPGSGKFGAHAWTCSGPLFVTGGDGIARFSPVGCFVWPPDFDNDAPDQAGPDQTFFSLP